MKTLTRVPGFLAVLAAGCCLVCGAGLWSGNGQTSSTTVSPDKKPAAAAPSLTPEEHERLMKLTRVAITPEAVQGEGAPDRRGPDLPPEKSAELAAQIEAADQLLGKLSQDPSPASSKAMVQLWESREPGIRATGLRWMAGRRDIQAGAIARGFQDRSSLVRLVAEQMLVENGVAPDAIAAVKSARAGSPADLERAVRAALKTVGPRK